MYRLIQGDLRSSKLGNILLYIAQFSVLVLTNEPSYKSSILVKGSEPRVLNPGARGTAVAALSPLQSGHQGTYDSVRFGVVYLYLLAKSRVAKRNCDICEALCIAWFISVMLSHGDLNIAQTKSIRFWLVYIYILGK